jgi:SOS-response transcriptional repressor LexA
VEKRRRQGKDRQGKILEFIEEYSRRHKFSPTVREIMEAVGLKTGTTVNFHLDNLQELGLVTWRKGLPRTVVVTELGKQTLREETS